MTGGTGAARGCLPEERTMGRAEHGSAPPSWPFRSYLELGPWPTAVPCARGHARLVMADVAAAEHLSALERLDYLIAGFASMVSHETRTALTGIQGMSELILSGDSDPDEVREYAKYIFNDAERLNRLLGDMLEVSRPQLVFHLAGEAHHSTSRAPVGSQTNRGAGIA